MASDFGCAPGLGRDGFADPGRGAWPFHATCNMQWGRKTPIFTGENTSTLRRSRSEAEERGNWHEADEINDTSSDTDPAGWLTAGRKLRRRQRGNGGRRYDHQP